MKTPEIPDPPEPVEVPLRDWYTCTPWEEFKTVAPIIIPMIIGFALLFGILMIFCR